MTVTCKTNVFALKNPDTNRNLSYNRLNWAFQIKDMLDQFVCSYSHSLSPSNYLSLHPLYPCMCMKYSMLSMLYFSF